MFKSFLFLVMISITVSSCKKDPVVFTDNTIPDYNEIPTITVRNYVNRLYIDLIGREPLNIEMDNDVQMLRNDNLSVTSRSQIIVKLTSNTDSLGADINYKTAYFRKIYNDIKARLLEGASDDYIGGRQGIFQFQATLDSLDGNWESFQKNKTEIAKLQAIIDSRLSLQNQEITIDEMYRSMMFNSIYDNINMNSFNFIDATYDNLFYRSPTQFEFDNAYSVIEYNQPAIIFGQAAINKSDYLNILTSVGEFETGLSQWIYLSYLSREPTTNESFDAINLYHENNTIDEIQLSILISDEYAGFN